MGIAGNLKTMLPGDLLQWLSLAQKTGTLVVSNGRVEKKIFFKNGRVISSASDDPREYLGQFLMSHGFITEPELKKAMEVQQQSGILLGKILVMIGAISERDLLRLMRLKAEEEIYDVFLWADGEFRFLDGELPQWEMVPLQVDVTGIIVEGMRRLDEWKRIREVVPDESVVPLMVGAAGENADLSEAERTIVGAIDGKRTIADLVLESRSSEFVVSQAVFRLVRSGAARIVRAGAEKVEERAPQKYEPTDEEEIDSLLGRAQSSLRAKDFEKAQRLLKAAQNLDPNHPRIRAAIKGAEAVIVAELRREGLDDSRIPRIIKPMAQLTAMNFTPHEGFLLSRINGNWDIGSLMKISPIRESDALLIFYKLWRDGVIALE
ncbi:MAG TPA: DUF4388 domain-containing protein [Thermoanaerobaculia bacterium]|nr:DUF4388 domain-containing protein [Thermoanaerobaculia bacterium]